MYDEEEYLEIIEESNKWQKKLEYYIEPQEGEEEKQFLLEIPYIKEEVRIMVESIKNMSARRVTDLITLKNYREKLIDLINDPILTDLGEIKEIERYIQSEWNVRVSHARQINLLTKALVLSLDEFEDYYVALKKEGIGIEPITDQNRMSIRERRSLMIEEKQRQPKTLTEEQKDQIAKLIEEYNKIKEKDDDRKPMLLNFKKEEIKKLLPDNHEIRKEVTEIFNKFTRDRLW